MDILVEIPNPYSLYDRINIRLDLEDEIGKKVDLIYYDSIKILCLLKSLIFIEVVLL